MLIHQNNRVVITGLGVYSSIGTNVNDFTTSLQKGVSGIKYMPEMRSLGFNCNIAGAPRFNVEEVEEFVKKYKSKKIISSGIYFGSKAGVEAWEDAGFSISDRGCEEPHWDKGVIMGNSVNHMESTNVGIKTIDSHQLKKLRSDILLQTMAGGISAYLGGILGLGNIVTTNSSACSTGTEAIIHGYNHIKNGNANVMLVGSSESSSPYIWGAFDSLRILTKRHNGDPEKGSRPMSATASGIVPGAGGGALVLESLEHAIQRNATIYGEVLGGEVNSGGQRGGGTITRANTKGMIKCIERAVEKSQIKSSEIDALSGHLTGTKGDSREIGAWETALDRRGEDFPQINSLKSMIGHCFAASGSIESVACVIQLKEQFLHKSMNCEDVDEQILTLIPKKRIPQSTTKVENLQCIAKSSFGFGDVNSCIVFKKWNHANCSSSSKDC